MFFDELVYGTHYYRAPTPTPSEWEYDYQHMVEMVNIDTVQFRVQWRIHEHAEDVYQFEDTDRLFDLAEKYNYKVVIQMHLENAPQYIYERYDGYRYTPEGIKIPPCSNGAFYVGGWLPCFHNPMVKERARAFVEKFTQRYQNRVYMYSVWNEPRIRPAQECYCEHCRHDYGLWLREKYGTIENLNKIFGLGEESFATIQLPPTTEGYWDIYLFKKWATGVGLRDRIQLVSDSIRKYDAEVPLVSHSGAISGIQSYIDDMGDEMELKKAVDFYGTSFATYGKVEDHSEAIAVQFLCDYTRGVDKNFFVYELYPNLGFFHMYDTPFDMKFKQYSIIGAGAKGIMYWQYRAERLGMENDCAGIVNMDGTEKDVTVEVRNFGNFLKKHGKTFLHANVPEADIAIAVDYDSKIMSAVEDGSKGSYTLERAGGLNCYGSCVSGGYKLFREMNFSVDFVHLHASDSLGTHKAVYVPYYIMADENRADTFKEYVKNGGILILDEGIGLRDRKTTWLRVDNVPYDFASLKLTKRRLIKDGSKLNLDGDLVTIYPYRTWFKSDAQVLANYDDGEPAVFEYSLGKGKILVFSTNVGHSYKKYGEEGWRNFIGKYLANNGIAPTMKYQDVLSDLYEQTLVCDRGQIEVLCNSSKEDREIELPSSYEILTEQTPVGNKVTLKSNDVLCFIDTTNV